jgi:CRISPR-associated protein Cmr2
LSTYLTVFSIGPVQEFIRAARRTRDLWAGSKILDCISKAAARALVEHHARLIFPHGGASLEDDAAPIANVLLAEIDSDDPGSFSTDLAPAVRRAAQGRWEDLSKEVSESRDWAKYIQTGRFKRQIASVLEINSAWLPLPSPASYRATRRDLMRILSGRKSCRNFDQFAGENGVPKSSLDGARESVWDIDALKTAPGKDRLSLRLNDGEQLDAVGIIKRVAFGKQPFPSVARIAADPWLRGLAPRQRSSLSAVCSNLRLDAWEGSVVFPNRLRELEKSKAWTPAEMDEIRRALKPLFTTNGEPHPY